MMTNKTRILFLERYLMENTDEEHTVPLAELLRLCSDSGMNLTRDTLRDDLQTLSDMGDQIESKREGKGIGYRIKGRLFSTDELRLLIDIIAASDLAGSQETEKLVNKLGQLTSRHMRSQLLTPRFFVEKSNRPDMMRHMEKSMLIIGKAIEKKCKLAFHYYEYNGYKEKVARRHGAEYVVQPYAMTCRDGRYYLIAYSDHRDKVISYRVDRMNEVRMLREAVSAPELDLQAYMRAMTRMYAGEPRRIELLCDDPMMKHIIDKFGQDAVTHKINHAQFLCEADVQISPTFFGWLFQYAGQIRVAGPADVEMMYQNMLKVALRAQQRLEMQ